MDFVVSTSGLNAFKRCPKSYQFGYEMGLTQKTPSEPLRDGSDFHAYAAAYAAERRGDMSVKEPAVPNDAMYEVFAEWARRRGAAEFDGMAKIVSVEEPQYTQLVLNFATQVWLRTTFDLVYMDTDGWIVCRDYKTFEKMPSIDADLDFQARGYIAALMQAYKTRKVRFEHVYIRRVPPGTPRTGKEVIWVGDNGATPKPYTVDAKGKRTPVEVWTEEECYVYESIVISPQEAKTLWSEAQVIARRILQTRQEGGPAWYRVDLKGISPFTCGSCFYKGACKAEDQIGTLSPQDIDLLGYVTEVNKHNDTRLPELKQQELPA